MRTSFLGGGDGISVIVPIHNGAGELQDLLMSLKNQSMDYSKFEIIFSLNGCTDRTFDVIDEFVKRSGVQSSVIESGFANVARARNKALQRARFRFATFVDHDDYISRGYLEECVLLGDYRSVVVSNIMKIEKGIPVEDYAQHVISAGFHTSSIHGPEDIALCYRAYTLNAIKTAPTYMLKRIRYSESLPHTEDIKYWRDVFHAFTPITVKSPSRRDIYFRKVFGNSLSRRDTDFYFKAKPRLSIIDEIVADSYILPCDSPQKKFDVQLKDLLNNTLANLGKT